MLTFDEYFQGQNLTSVHSTSKACSIRQKVALENPVASVISV